MRVQFALVLFSLLLFFKQAVFAGELLSSIELGPNQVALVAYGSLMSRASLSRTLGYSYQGVMQRVELKGFARDFDIVMPNRSLYYEERDGEKHFPDGIAYLDIVESPHEVINAILIVVDQSLLSFLDKREWIYDRIAIAPEQLNVQVHHGPIFAYRGKPEHRLPSFKGQAISIRGSYIDILRDALKELSPQFIKTFFSTTRHSNLPLILDRNVNDRHQKQPDFWNHGLSASQYCRMALGIDEAFSDGLVAQ